MSSQGGKVGGEVEGQVERWEGRLGAGDTPLPGPPPTCKHGSFLSNLQLCQTDGKLVLSNPRIGQPCSAYLVCSNSVGAFSPHFRT
eukprot:1143400-Pelagomonas_calceolata.AAC.6